MQLSDNEKAIYNSCKQTEENSKGEFLLPTQPSKPVRHPNFVYKYDSLFPNFNINFLDIEENYDSFQKKIENFKTGLCEKFKKERDVLRYLKYQGASFMITSVLRDFDFGHHDRYIFPEFALGDYYKADFLVIGKSSGGYEFIFIELESPCKGISTKNGDFSVSINKGLKQVNEWNRWIQNNFKSIRYTLEKYKKPEKNLPPEFFDLSMERIHFAVIAGRRKHYNPNTYQRRRELKRGRLGVRLFHYDNVIELSIELISSKRW
jgi:hypothetical protein